MHSLTAPYSVIYLCLPTYLGQIVKIATANRPIPAEYQQIFEGEMRIMAVIDRHVLIIRHEACSSLGMLNAALLNHQVPCHYLDISTGQKLDKAIEEFSHLVILGGPISAYEDDIYPFLKYEFELVKEAIAKEIPTLGICLGSQVLAKVLGAGVYRGESGREAGWCEMHLTNAATHDPLFKDFPALFRVFESHQDTFDLPAEAVHLAFSGKYVNQAFRYRHHVWALQFHLEMDHHVLGDCRGIVEQELKDSKIFDTTIDDLLQEAEHYSQFVAPLASNLMGNFLEVSSRQLAV